MGQEGQERLSHSLWHLLLPMKRRRGLGLLSLNAFVKKKSGGQLEVQIYPAGQMGTDREILESTQFGSISIGYTGLTQWTNFVEDLNYLDGPFVCSTREQVYSLF